jgi:hypothetical protein
VSACVNDARARAATQTARPPSRPTRQMRRRQAGRLGAAGEPAPLFREHCDRLAGPREASPQRFDFAETADLDHSKERPANDVAAERLGRRQLGTRLDGTRGVDFPRRLPRAAPVTSRALGEAGTDGAAEQRPRTIDEDVAILSHVSRRFALARARASQYVDRSGTTRSSVS